MGALIGAFGDILEEWPRHVDDRQAAMRDQHPGVELRAHRIALGFRVLMQQPGLAQRLQKPVRHGTVDAEMADDVRQFQRLFAADHEI